MILTPEYRLRAELDHLRGQLAVVSKRSARWPRVLGGVLGAVAGAGAALLCWFHVLAV
jgi:hypothetical protein